MHPQISQKYQQNGNQLPSTQVSNAIPKTDLTHIAFNVNPPSPNINFAGPRATPFQYQSQQDDDSDEGPNSSPHTGQPSTFPPYQGMPGMQGMQAMPGMPGMQGMQGMPWQPMVSPHHGYFPQPNLPPLAGHIELTKLVLEQTKLINSLKEQLNMQQQVLAVMADKFDYVYETARKANERMDKTEGQLQLEQAAKRKQEEDDGVYARQLEQQMKAEVAHGRK